MYSRKADPDVMSASILYRLGRVSLQERRPGEALKIFQLGQISAQQVGDVAESARLHANEAWAYAMLGRRQQMQDALAHTEDLLGQVQPDNVRPWTWVFMVPGRSDWPQGTCRQSPGRLSRRPSGPPRKLPNSRWRRWHRRVGTVPLAVCYSTGSCWPRTSSATGTLTQLYERRTPR